MDTTEKHRYWDHDALDEQFGTDRRERMLDATAGMGPGRRGPDGRHYHQDRHSGDWEPMSNEDVERTYLSGPVVDET
jgi:hypothetical protein